MLHILINAIIDAEFRNQSGIKINVGFKLIRIRYECGLFFNQ